MKASKWSKLGLAAALLAIGVPTLAVVDHCDFSASGCSSACPSSFYKLVGGTYTHCIGMTNPDGQPIQADCCIYSYADGKVYHNSCPYQNYDCSHYCDPVDGYRDDGTDFDVCWTSLGCTPTSSECYTNL